MGIHERRDRERDRTRATILNAAREMFLRDGFEAVSMRRIADAIEYSPTAIYVHFRDKDALFRELCREDFDRLAAAFAQLASVPDPVERVLRLGHGYIRFALEHPNHYRLMFMTVRPPSSEQPESKGRGNPDEDAYAMLRHTVAEAVAQKRFRREFNDVELAAQILWSVPHGVASLQITKGCDHWIDWRPIEARAAGALESILRGMLADPSQLPSPRKTRKGRSK